ncbi:YybH family protein [Sphingomonas alpina]|uniref:DUF3225 domain-containing protein n=1 Tax=Sphingomonas alpina TaxID=653931 RepID=A0A7H0LM27_9SPHN|nr:nuclear transport factor 2 family protein [Sphingomonas alpina]QNQ10730.1 DUF3225 domain-containing protein [Sphingomonas alpina]
MIKTILAASIAAIAVTASPVIAVPAAAARPEAARIAVQEALDASAAAWNAADLDRFMTVYENAPGTVYIGGGNVVRGYQAIRDMYAGRFGGGSAAAMGQLKLEILDFRLTDRDHAFIVGRFHLHRDAASGGDASGLTSLLFHRTSAGWRIVADHS